jgi:hypothetical protein
VDCRKAGDELGDLLFGDFDIAAASVGGQVGIIEI